MRPSTKVVATGLFLVVEARQDMVRVARNGDEQLVVGSYSQGLNRRKICLQVATPPQSSQEPLHPRDSNMLLRLQHATQKLNTEQQPTHEHCIYIFDFLKFIRFS